MWGVKPKAGVRFPSSCSIFTGVGRSRPVGAVLAGNHPRLEARFYTKPNAMFMGLGGR